MKSLIITKYLPLSKKNNQPNISRFNTFTVKEWLIFTNFKKPELHEYLYPIFKLPISLCGDWYLHIIFGIHIKQISGAIRCLNLGH